MLCIGERRIQLLLQIIILDNFTADFIIIIAEPCFFIYVRIDFLFICPNRSNPGIRALFILFCTVNFVNCLLLRFPLQLYQRFRKSGIIPRRILYIYIHNGSRKLIRNFEFPKRYIFLQFFSFFILTVVRQNKDLIRGSRLQHTVNCQTILFIIFRQLLIIQIHGNILRVHALPFHLQPFRFFIILYRIIRNLRLIIIHDQGIVLRRTLLIAVIDRNYLELMCAPGFQLQGRYPASFVIHVSAIQRIVRVIQVNFYVFYASPAIVALIFIPVHIKHLSFQIIIYV